MFSKLRKFYNSIRRYEKVEDGLDKVHKLTLGGDVETLYLYLIKNRSDINRRDRRDRTPLHIACAAGDDDKVNLLTALQADMNLSDGSGHSALMTAVQSGHEDCVKILLENRADINMQDANGDTALHQATSLSNRSIVTLLLDAGADIDAQNINGHTPLFTSVCKNNIEIAAFLIEKRADIVMTDVKGKTALMLAAENGQSDMVEVLLKCGACKTKQDEIGGSAEDFALNNSNQVSAALIAYALELKSENKNQKPCNTGKIRSKEEYDFSDSDWSSSASSADSSNESSMMEKMHSRIYETPKKKVSFSPINAICEFNRDEPPSSVSKSHEEREEQVIQETSGQKGPEELGLTMQARYQDSSLATQEKSVSGLLQEKCDCDKILKQTEERNNELLREAAELKEKVAVLEEAKCKLEELKNKDVLAMQVNKLSSDLVAQRKLLSEGEAQQEAIKDNLALSQSKCEKLQEQLQEATRKFDCDKTTQQAEERKLLSEARDLKDKVVRLKEEKRKSEINTLKWEEELKQKEALVIQVKELRSYLAAQKKLVSEVEERNNDLVREATELKNQVISLDEVENDREDNLRQLQQELANTQHDLEVKKGYCKKVEQDNVSLLRNVEQLNRKLAESGNQSQSPKTYAEEQEKTHVVAVQKLQKASNSDQEEIVQRLKFELARQNKTMECQILKIAGLEKQVRESDVLKGELGELKRENVRLLRCVDQKERKRGIATQKLHEALSASIVSAAAIKSLEEAVQRFAFEITQKEATIERQSSKITALQKQVQESVGLKTVVNESKKEIVRLLRCAEDSEKAHAHRLQDVLSTSSATIESREKEVQKLLFDTVQQQTTIKCQSFQIEGLNKLAREAVWVKPELEEKRRLSGSKDVLRKMRRHINKGSRRSQTQTQT